MEKDKNAFVDITDVVCPMTFVKAKVALEEIEVGEIIEVKMSDGEAIQNVPRSFKDEGHKVIEVRKNNDGVYSVFVRKGE